MASVTALETEQEYIKGDVAEIKADVKTLAEKPGQRWESVVEKMLMLVLAGIVGAVLALGLNKV